MNRNELIYEILSNLLDINIDNLGGDESNLSHKYTSEDPVTNVPLMALNKVGDVIKIVKDRDKKLLTQLQQINNELTDLCVSTSQGGKRVRRKTRNKRNKKRSRKTYRRKRKQMKK